MRRLNATTVPLNERALLNKKDLAAYLGVGQTKATEIGRKAGAQMKIGSRTLFKRNRVDEYLLDTH